MTRCASLGLTLCAGLAQGCSGQQSALSPGSADAALVVNLWWSMLAVAALVLLAVSGLALAAVLVGRGKALKPAPSDLTRRAMVFAGGLVLPMLSILALVIGSLHVGQTIAAREASADVTVEIIGKQWWWEINYLDDEGNPIATTANEIHIPVDSDVRFLLKSDNVIHSFWVPNLQGKTDLIPGRINETWLRAAESGTYRGQCAEFCGIQHAFMAFLVIAEPKESFAAWLDRQSRDSALAGDPAWAEEREIFSASGCGGCHTVRGTSAIGTLGPDLTHVGSRRTLAGATIPNTPDHLADWIEDPQAVKPGNAMPVNALPEKDIHVLTDYLTHLK